MTFRPSELHRRAFPMFGTLLLAVLLLSACSTTRNRGGYRGPSEYKWQTIAAVDQARAELSQELNRPLKWDWSRNRVELRLLDAVGNSRGVPVISHGDGVAYGFATHHRITLPHGYRRPTLVHEAGHVVMFQNGINDSTGPTPISPPPVRPNGSFRGLPQKANSLQRDEWVALLQGEAELRFESGESSLLHAGDSLIITAHRRHRVERTSHNAVWLALHF